MSAGLSKASLSKTEFRRLTCFTKLLKRLGGSALVDGAVSAAAFFEAVTGSGFWLLIVSSCCFVAATSSLRRSSFCISASSEAGGGASAARQFSSGRKKHVRARILAFLIDIWFQRWLDTSLRASST